MKSRMMPKQQVDQLIILLEDCQSTLEYLKIHKLAGRCEAMAQKLEHPRRKPDDSDR